VSDELIASGYFGEELNQKIRDNVTRQVTFNSLVEMLPNPNNRVTLAKEEDSLGIPRPFIKFKLDNYTRAGFAKARELHQLLFNRLNATQIHHYTDDQWVDSGHIIGTTVMGNDPGISVVDKNLKCHDHENLFILGSGVFPSSFCSNPTLTIAALALRAANHI